MEAEWNARRAERERARLARQERFDEERSNARITMLQNQAEVGFMRHVLAHPASAAQRAEAEEKLAKHEQEAARLAAQVGDPDEVHGSSRRSPARPPHLAPVEAHDIPARPAAGIRRTSAAAEVQDRTGDARAGRGSQRQDVWMTSGVMTLPDGRRLSWHEFGDPDGSPVIYTAGTPVSGLGGGSYDETARAAGLRWISPDKPGYGGSDYQRQRSLTSWADDLAALAGHLGLDRFALAGESGGGPFTLAAALRLAGRVSVAALIAGAGAPMGPAERAGQQARIRF